MRREKRLFLLLAAVIAAGMVGGLIVAPEGERVERLTLRAAAAGESGLDPVSSQKSGDRIWREQTLDSGFTVGQAPGPLLSLPVSIRTDTEGNLYILDWTDKCVRKYSRDGEPCEVFGGQAGQGPGEFSNPTDFDVDAAGAVWICDPVNARITVFGPDATFLKTIRSDRPPYRIVLCGAEGYVLMFSPAGAALFSRHDLQGTPTGSFGVLVDQQQRVGIVLDGRVAGAGDGRFVYAAYRTGILGICDLPAYTFVHTIDDRGLPEMISRRSGDAHYMRVAPDARRASANVSLSGDEVHVHSGFRTSEKRGVMDVYAFRDGRYRFSYLLPAGIAVAHVSGDRLFGIGDTTVTMWRIRSSNEAQAEAI